MSEIITVRDSEIIAAEINTIKEDTRRIMIANAIRIGGKLAEAKAMVPYGEWGKWLEEKVDYSQSTADDLMRLYREYGENQSSLFDNWTDSETFANLTYTQHIVLLALPFADRREFAETHNVEDMSTRELKKAVQEELDAARAELTEAQAGKDAAEERAADLAEQLAEAQRLTNAQQDAAQLARDEVNRLNGELETARKQVDKNTREADRLRKQLTAAQDSEKKIRDQLQKVKDNPEIPESVMERMRQEVEADAAQKATAELQKKLDAALAAQQTAEKTARTAEEQLAAAQRAAKMSDPVITETIVRAKKLQNDFNELNGLRLKQLAGGDPEAIKTAGAMRKIMADMVEQMLKIVNA